MTPLNTCVSTPDDLVAKEREAFEAHIKTTAWYQVLSLAKDEDEDGASVFRMARMAADAAWQARASTAHAGEPTDRTPRDFAIEHAEYMAKDAERLISAVNDLALAESEREDGTANPSDVDAARETVSEAQRSLTSGIYEFRKRRDRALAAAPKSMGGQES